MATDSTHAGIDAQPQTVGTPWARIIGGILLSLLSSVMLIVCWTSFGGLWWLTFVAFVPMYVAQYRVFPRKWSGVAVGLAVGAYWLALLLHGSSVLPTAAVAAGAVVMALVGWGVGVFLRPFTERTGYRWYLVQLPILWVGLDVLIQDNEIFGTYSWLAYRLGEAPQLVQPVSVLSSPVLSFLVIVWNAWLALLIMRLLDKRKPQWVDVAIPASVFRWSTIVTLVACVVWVGSSLLIYQQVTAQMGPTIRVGGVQPGLKNATPGTLIALAGGDGRTERQRRLDQAEQLSQMTKQAADQGAQLVVWPEETLDYDPRVTGPDWIPALVRQTGVYLVMGFVADHNDPTSDNVALMWAPDGTVIGDYNKVHRVLAEGEAFTPGTVFPTMQTALGPIGMIICFDIDFPNSSARLETLTGSQVIAAPSIDFQSIAPVRTDSTVFRAIENRIGMAKVDVAWDSAIVAPNGQVLSSTLIDSETGGEALLLADLPRGPRGAPFTELGGLWFGMLLGLAAAWMVVEMVRTSRAARRR